MTNSHEVQKRDTILCSLGLNCFIEVYESGHQRTLAEMADEHSVLLIRESGQEVLGCLDASSTTVLVKHGGVGFTPGDVIIHTPQFCRDGLENSADT